MLQVIFELSEISSIKDKRQVVRSLKDRIRRKFKVSIAEIDLTDSLKYCHLGLAYVTNDKKLGESVMAKIEDFLEENVPGRVHDSSVYIEYYG